MRAAALIAVTALLLVCGPAVAQTPAGDYTPCEPVGDASIVSISVASCEDATVVAIALTTAPPADAAAVLTAAGWSALRARTTDDEREHDLVAIRGPASLRIRRPGPAPDLDGWSAGRELLFARPTLVAGARPPRGAVVCTSAFLVRLPAGRLGGLSASHCGGTRKDGTVQRRNAALRRPPQPGIVLGRVRRNLGRTRPLDALLLPVPSGQDRAAPAAVVDRGISRPPWRVTAAAQPLSGRRVCFTGRTSGIDRCGEIIGGRARPAERILRLIAGVVVRCTTIPAREGDSGGPVYTAPRADGTVRAIGITTLVVGDMARMCFTPLAPVLDALGATLVTADPAAAPGAG